MRTATAIATCLLAGIAFADTEFQVQPDRIEMKTAAHADATDADRDTKPASVTRAQDYNSSRSNTTSLRQGDDKVVRKKPGRTTTAGASSSNSNRPADRAASARDYNSSRSNIGAADRVDHDDDSDSDLMYDRCDRTVGDGVDDDCDSVRGAAAPANHNTTRSNRTIN